MGDVLLNIAGVLPNSHVNGPGKRIVIWVQGCTKGCAGCFNKELQSHTPKHLVEPLSFAKKLIDLAEQYNCEGFTISGGEPFQQSRAVAILAEELKTYGYSIISFTGYPFKTISESKDSNVLELLNNLDVVIAGQYDQELEHRCAWKDIPDKEIIFLTDAYTINDFKDMTSSEYLIDTTGVYYTGFIDSEIALFEILKR